MVIWSAASCCEADSMPSYVYRHLCRYRSAQCSVLSACENASASIPAKTFDIVPHPQLYNETSHLWYGMHKAWVFTSPDEHENSDIDIMSRHLKSSCCEAEDHKAKKISLMIVNTPWEGGGSPLAIHQFFQGTHQQNVTLCKSMAQPSSDVSRNYCIAHHCLLRITCS